ncbi:DUF6750 family protein [Ornithinimicrobium murale]|uniref:DUF6750 family protein n=1 Tax=Ornithinimicrobium murale TaxID=1050153 RepID=UPI000E0CDF81|nr:DUF6750 family protein [Ornithinimicrobium murale]
MITNLATAVDFVGPWDKFWGAIASSAEGIVTLAAVVGVVLVVSSIFMWIFKKARGGGANTSTLVWMIIVGGILCAPTILIPTILRILQFVINGIEKVAALGAS